MSAKLEIFENRGTGEVRRAMDSLKVSKTKEQSILNRWRGGAGSRRSGRGFRRVG
jgi:hypothetical protein